jgi:predicted AlkP superfamily phosphohydrolase/phosphomutase
MIIIGLDCAAPELVFDRWIDELPNMRKLRDEGVHGKIKSTIPPITVPAWMSMMTSKDPGQLGVYGFRNRKSYNYFDFYIATSSAIKEKIAWQYLSDEGIKVGLLGVPQTYPPKPVNGFLVSGFLTPDTDSRYTYPDELKNQIESVVGNYIIDAEEYRTEQKDVLLSTIYEMTEKRFKLAGHFLDKERPEFFMMVEMGTDRIHHGFWKYFDEEHSKYVPDSKYKNAIRDYYQLIDDRIGSLLSFVDDRTSVMIVSDHGAKKMDGAINVNDWLEREGYLTRNQRPDEPARLEDVDVDWSKTKAWGMGGYYGRVFINVKGREPKGIVDPGDYERVRDELIAKLEGIVDENGRNIGTKVHKPQDIYKAESYDYAPDLIVLFGDLFWRSTGSIGHGSIYSYETEVGPDDAVHSQYGMFILYNPQKNYKGLRKGVELLDGAPTILDSFGLRIPEDMLGKVIR